MNYPSLRIDSRSYRVEIDDGSVEDRADDGTLLVRSFYPLPRYRITLTHPMLTADQYKAHRQFCRTYRFEPVDFTDPLTGDTYNVLIRQQPSISAVQGGAWITCSVVLEGVLSV